MGRCAERKLFEAALSCDVYLALTLGLKTHGNILPRPTIPGLSDYQKLCDSPQRPKATNQ